MLTDFPVHAMLINVALLACPLTPPPRYPHDAWEMLLGYDQDRFMGGRAGAALVKHIQVAAGLGRDREGC